MGPRYNEGYIKGVHDHDAAKILTALARLHRDLGLLRYGSVSRALANLAWATAASESNRTYIASAAQADAYRTEPAVQLQGSYRDMNKLAERVIAMMNDEELEALIESHYQNQAQALATGAESNLLKFLELSGRLHGDKRQRWEDIQRTFQRNLALGNINQDDAAGQIIARLALFAEGLVSIQRAVERGTASLVEAAGPRENPQQQLLLAQVGQSARSWRD